MDLVSFRSSIVSSIGDKPELFMYVHEITADLHIYSTQMGLDFEYKYKKQQHITQISSICTRGKMKIRRNNNSAKSYSAK